MLLALINPPSIGETSRPILVSDTQTLSVTIDGEPYANGQWELSPKFDPDLLLIRSKLPYGSKQVTFSSGVDSITFDVQAGNDYDFTVLRNEETPCHIRIAALADPWCWSYQVLLPTLAIAVVLVTALTMKRRQIATSRLLAMGLVAPLLFWVITIVLGAILTDYNHLQNTISELGSFPVLGIPLPSILGRSLQGLSGKRAIDGTRLDDPVYADRLLLGGPVPAWQRIAWLARPAAALAQSGRPIRFLPVEKSGRLPRRGPILVGQFPDHDDAFLGIYRFGRTILRRPRAATLVPRLDDLVHQPWPALLQAHAERE